MEEPCELIEERLIAAFVENYPRLVRMCAHMSGRAEMAEELAQQTLIQAWALRSKVHHTEALPAWLVSIARYTCLRARRTSAREQKRTVDLDGSEILSHRSTSDRWHRSTEGVRGIERAELKGLLTRALDTLPPLTRQVMIARYVEDRSQADIAEALEITVGALEMRVQRGKRALRRALSTDFRSELEPYRFLDEAGYEERSRRWCPHCGGHRLIVHDDPERRRLSLYCPTCVSDAGAFLVGNAYPNKRIQASYWPFFSAMMASTSAFFRQHLSIGYAPCTRCGGRATVQPVVSEDAFPALRQMLSEWVRPTTRILYSACDRCNNLMWAYSTETALYHPEGLRFWRTHRRIRTLAERQVQASGRSLLLTRMESLDGQAHLEICYDPVSYQVLHVE